MDHSYQYVKIRKDFGKQPMFCEVQSEILDSIEPDLSLQKKYCLRNPVNREVQASTSHSEHYLNTKTVVKRDQGMNHAEGGWPKDIHFADEESTARYRRRVERDDLYVHAILDTYPEFEHYINQNNAIDMYKMYFEEIPPVNPIEKSFIHVNCIFKDQDQRPIGCIDWTNEDSPKLVVAYCDKKIPEKGLANKNLNCSVWDLENPREPCDEFCPPTACLQLACSPTNPSVVIGGLEDGRVCIFDVRAQSGPLMLSPAYLAHRDPVTALLYIHSRLNNEFFDGSSDGLCMWWDVRNFSYPIDTMTMSVRIPPGEQISQQNSEGVSTLQYDRAFPTKFLCGTDTGMVINVNRKGKSHQEIMSGIFNAHNGPVKALHRSVCTSKMFITCGDFCVHIWSEDVYSSPIISGTPHKHQINDVVWAPLRVSCYMSVSADGKFRYWDVLRKYHEPVITWSVSKHDLLKLKPHEDGKLIAIGDAKGMLTLLKLSENLIFSGDKDKLLMMQIYDRETRRERILENRVKEIKLKLKADEDAQAVDEQPEQVDDEALLDSVTAEFHRVILEERQRDIYAPHSPYSDDRHVRIR